MNADTTRRALLPLAVSILTAPALAQDRRAFPNRVVRFIVPFPAGQGTDIVARLLADRLALQWPNRAIVENRPGGGGAIGMEAAARVEPDGHTLLMGSIGPISVLPAVSSSLTYDPQRDFVPVARVVDLPLVFIASPASGIRTLGDLIERAKARPGEVDYGSGGTASSQHMAMELLASRAGITLNHIPYRGSAQAMTDLVAGTIAVMCDSLSSALPQIRDGKVIPLAAASLARFPQIPDVPTAAEAGVPGYEAVGWAGMLAPARTPPEIVAALNAAVVQAMDEPEVRARVAELGAVVALQSPEEFGRFIAAELAKWRQVSRERNIRLD
jgi:tripartite-type tricarboxylate transporter receptor subunit TctC